VIWVAGFVAAGGVFVLSLLAVRAAYRNGVTDGYGFAKEPGCPGYRAAGEFLQATMSHRWPELSDAPPPMAVEGTPPVELWVAWEWKCPHCWTESFVRSIKMEEPEGLPFGEFVTKPDAVKCPVCRSVWPVLDPKFECEDHEAYEDDDDDDDPQYDTGSIPWR